MFTENSTISFDPISFGLNVLELDNEKLATIFTEAEIELINTLTFFEETVKVPIVENDVPSEVNFVYLDSFAITVYDFIKGSITLNAMPDEELDEVINEYPYIVDRQNLVDRMAEAKVILYKYNPDLEGKFF